MVWFQVGKRHPRPYGRKGSRIPLDVPGDPHCQAHALLPPKQFSGEVLITDSMTVATLRSILA